MAEVCAGCGSAAYLQAQVNTHECLNCGAITEDATGAVLPQLETPPRVSNHGYPVRELSTSTAGDVGDGEDRRVRPVGPQPPAVVLSPDPLPARSDADGLAYWATVTQGGSAPVEDAVDGTTPAAVDVAVAESETEIVDLSQLSPEQAEAVQRILGESA